MPTQTAKALAELDYVVEDRGRKTHELFGLRRTPWVTILNGSHPPSAKDGAVRTFPRPLPDSLQAILCHVDPKARKKLSAAMAGDVFAFVEDWSQADQEDVWAGLESLAKARRKALRNGSAKTSEVSPKVLDSGNV